MARPTSWTPVREQELKPRAPRLPRGRPVGERARRWRRMMDEGLYPSMSALARAEGVTPAAVSKALLRLRDCHEATGSPPYEAQMVRSGS